MINFKLAGIRLLVFGGTGEVAEIGGFEDVLAKEFSVQGSKRSWKMIGAAPSTVECSQSGRGLN